MSLLLNTHSAIEDQRNLEKTKAFLGGRFEHPPRLVEVIIKLNVISLVFTDHNVMGNIYIYIYIYI